VDRSEQLAKLLNPASVAVVGASQRAGWGLTTIENLDGIGFTGRVYPVNPRYQEIAGRQCFAALRDLPGPPDAVAIAVPAAAVPAAIEEAIACGAGAAVVYASGFGAPGEGEGGSTGQDSLRARLTRIGRDKRIAIQGPNCLGLINYARRAAMWGITMPFDHAGTDSGVALIAQSGNMALTLSGANRGLRLTHLASCGNQLDVTAAELMTASLADPAVRAIAVLLEGIPDPGLFRAALVQAADRDVPVVVLKVGTSERARQAAIAHTGSLSGAAAVHRSFFRQFGAIQVDDLDELAATVAVLTAPRRPRGGGVAIFASSGGECGLASDIAESLGVALPDVPEPLASELSALLPGYGHVANPLDLTAGGWGDAALYEKVIGLLARVPGVSAVVGVGDAPTLGGGELVAGWDGIISGLCAGAALVGPSGTVVAGLSSVADLHPDVPVALAAGGVVPLAGLRPGLSALAKAGWYAQWRSRPRDPAARPGSSIPADAEHARKAAAARRLLDGHGPGPVPEDLAKHVLACYGIDSPGREIARSPAGAAAAAARIGYPVAVKVAAAGVHHKTEVGGVLLDLGSAEEVERAAATLLEVGRRSDPAAAVLVERFVAGGLELIVGGRRDDLFGPLVLVGLGGILAEFLADVAHRVAPVTEGEAETMIGELAGRSLLDGFRGRPGVNVTQLARAVVAVSRLLTDHEDIVELDINPLVADPASETGMPLALDALLVLGAGQRRRSSELPAEAVRRQALASKTGADHG
jgi:acyl-CoA synthetase (NDP forming)